MSRFDKGEWISTTHNNLERQVLLALLGPRETQDQAAILPLLRQVNWADFIEIASADLYPYLAFSLEPYIEIPDAPAEWEQFSEARRSTAIHNLRLRHELGKALEALRQSGIPALALKGVVLAHAAYPEPSLRPMTDVDLLVPPGKREEAVQVMRKLGYEYSESTLALDRDQVWDVPANEEYVPPLRLGTSGVLLEIHSELECSEPSLPISVEEFWTRSIPVELFGLRARTLCPEDFLLHLCLHQSRHHRFEKGLLPLVDLRLLLDSHSDWNWKDIVERSLRGGCSTWMYLTLEFARDLAGAVIPDSVFQDLSQPGDLWTLRRMVEAQLWSAHSRRPKTPPFLTRLVAERSWQTRARLIVTRMRFRGLKDRTSKSDVSRAPKGPGVALQRLLATLKAKFPKYVHAWRTGQLKIRNIRRNGTLMRSSIILSQLIEQKSIPGQQGRPSGGISPTRVDVP